MKKYLRDFGLGQIPPIARVADGHDLLNCES